MSELPHRTNKHPPPPDVTDGLGLSEDETSNPDLENPNISSNFPPDYSDVPSSGVDENGKQRRRYERGGRKKASPRQQHEQKYSSPKTSSSSRPTGIRSFSVKRTESGSARPFGVTLEKPQSQSQSNEKPKTKNPIKKEAVKPVEPVEFEQYPISDEDEQQVGENEDEVVDDEDEEEEEVRAQEPKEETRRPFAIRLDLNLEIEIFLKAKIKGDVTITFLE